MASKYLPKYPVPEEFPEILHDFSRMVLRDQPENIYEFGAQYFKAIYEVSISIAKMRWQLYKIRPLLTFYQGKEFDYGDKGKNIPPGKDNMPDTSNFRVIQASENAHLMQDAPEGYQQQYQMTAEEYAAAIQHQQMLEQQQLAAAEQMQYLEMQQQQQDAGAAYVQGLMEQANAGDPNAQAELHQMQVQA